MTSTQPPSRWISRAPASTMVLGEHAVVYGEPALVSALDQWLTIHWQRLDARELRITSALGDYAAPLDDLHDDPKLRFVLAPLRQQAHCLTSGVELRIESEISPTMGLGSSAAALAATLVGLQPLLTGSEPHRLHLFQQGRELIQMIQGRGSGADLAASLYGGTILLDPKLPAITPIPFCERVTLIYSGYKTPTGEVLERVAQAWDPVPELRDDLYHLMGETTRRAVKALADEDITHPLFNRLFNVYHGLMDALGVCDLTLAKIVYEARELGHAAKISGSGLGDCVLALGEVKLPGYECLTLDITEDGAEWWADA